MNCVPVHVCKNRDVSIENGPLLDFRYWIGGCSGGQPEIVSQTVEHRAIIDQVWHILDREAADTGNIAIKAVPIPWFVKIDFMKILIGGNTAGSRKMKLIRTSADVSLTSSISTGISESRWLYSLVTLAFTTVAR
ncbi:hypothetical protein DERF_008155 [Dermatophagoides farinae]|uniref:Uncharacterized protein n=1 Tax=Dermatophagoides farinae TaxID=6954 RepID=A0A922L8W0_DERFA|nr:hypothetical protein DERF_008155 [Dermatophagoides farinae]